MLALRNINVVFARGTPDENHALKNIALDIEKGDFITVIGSNGAGKSTLLNVIAGTYPAESGTIALASPEGELDITRESEYRRARRIGRIFQNPLLGTAGNMSLEDNLVICEKKGYRGLKFSLNHTKRAEFREKIKRLGLGLEGRLRDNVGLFSGGQRQALTLLMTVLSKPEILLLDEHTAALDPVNAELVMNLTRDFAREQNLTVLMITHNMKHALETGNRLLMMDAGEIILDITGTEKQSLTLHELQTRFKAAKHRDLESDEMLLSGAT
ncbi:MAG: ATP-binding cassette domain-containing protein [Spirochaetaceae bacterium]|jgi:putative ABC transport system ATP-binding protein|nr:ATP-binding cassette domain-containing protein [Spirochaetaceae bacterium]